MIFGRAANDYVHGLECEDSDHAIRSDAPDIDFSNRCHREENLLCARRQDGCEDGIGDQSPIPRDREGVKSYASPDSGAKNISFFAGCMLLINNITGPGVPELANMFSEAGWLFPVLCIFGVWFMTTLGASMYCEAMRKVPGNEHFRARIEYMSVAKWYFGRRGYIAAQIGMNGAMQSVNVISIIQCTRMMDNFVSVLFGVSCALNLTPFKTVWTNSTGDALLVSGSSNVVSCQNTNHFSEGNAWGCHVVVSVGFLLIMSLVVPVGRWNLDDNVIIQAFSFWITVVCWLTWGLMSAFIVAGSWNTDGGISIVNTDTNTGSQMGVLGMVLFNFSFVTTVPSWVNEKQVAVGINHTLWSSTFLCMLVFFITGLPGAMAFQGILKGPETNTCRNQIRHSSFNCHSSLMSILADSGSLPEPLKDDFVVTVLGKFSAYTFPLVSVASTIPVVSIIIKYNMRENRFSRSFSFFWGVVLPWVIALPLAYMPNIVAELINVTTLSFVTLTDFVGPLLIYAKMQTMEMKGEGANNDDKFHLPAGACVHHAVPIKFGISCKTKYRCAITIALVLFVTASIAFVEAASHLDFSVSACAHVGS